MAIISMRGIYIGLNEINNYSFAAQKLMDEGTEVEQVLIGK